MYKYFFETLFSGGDIEKRRGRRDGRHGAVGVRRAAGISTPALSALPSSERTTGLRRFRHSSESLFGIVAPLCAPARLRENLRADAVFVLAGVIQEWAS